MVLRLAEGFRAYSTVPVLGFDSEVKQKASAQKTRKRETTKINHKGRHTSHLLKTEKACSI